MMSTIKIPNNNAMLQGLTSSPSNFDVNVDEQDIPQVVISDSLLVKESKNNKNTLPSYFSSLEPYQGSIDEEYASKRS